jgi:predicted outer membrane repeat protein
MNMDYRTAWSDYFPGTSPTTPLNPKKYNERQTVSNANVYVSNCLFSECTSTSNGGALYCSSVTYLLVETTSFFSCKTSSECGAICYSNSGNSECVLNKVCGNDCCTTGNSYFLFASITVKSSSSSKNYVNYSSLVRCVGENPSLGITIYLYYGKVCCPSVNISMNKCLERPGFSCHPTAESNSITLSLSYSTFADNNATKYTCLYSNNENAKNEMKCCNILRNTQVELASNGVICLRGNTLIEDSCILNNKADCIFYTSSSSITTLSRCTIDKTTIGAGSLTIQSTVTKSFILTLNHMSTQNCNAEYDSAGTPTPIIIIHYYSCKNYFNQPRLREFISLICVFMFNFIHPRPSAGL